jgi:hypothetical protein
MSDMLYNISKTRYPEEAKTAASDSRRERKSCREDTHLATRKPNYATVRPRTLSASLSPGESGRTYAPGRAYGIVRTVSDDQRPRSSWMKRFSWIELQYHIISIALHAGGVDTTHTYSSFDESMRAEKEPQPMSAMRITDGFEICTTH